MAERTRERPEAKGATTSNGRVGSERRAVEQMATPDDLKAYEEVAPGSAAKVMDVFIAQSDHYCELEKRQMRHTQSRNIVGMFILMVIGLGVFGVSAWLINGGHEKPGTILGILDLLGVFTMLIVHRGRF